MDFFSKETDHYRVEKWNVSQSILSNACDPIDTHQAPLSMEFSRQEHWIAWPFSSPGDLPYLGIKPGSPALQADSLPTELWRKPLEFLRKFQMSHPDPRPMETGSLRIHMQKSAFYSFPIHMYVPWRISIIKYDSIPGQICSQ